MMATLGGNSVHTAAAATACGARVALVARRGEDFPAEAFDAAHRGGRGHDVRRRRPRPDRAQLGDLRAGRSPALGLPHPGRAARPRWRRCRPTSQPAVPGARVVHVAAMPLGNAEAVVAEVRRVEPSAVITLDTHEGWADEPAARVLALAGSRRPLRAEPRGAPGPDRRPHADRWSACARPGRRTTRGGEGGRRRCLRDDRMASSSTCPPSRSRRSTPPARVTRSAEAWRPGSPAVSRPSTPSRSGVAAAGTAIGSSGSLRLLDHDGEVLRGARPRPRARRATTADAGDAPLTSQSPTTARPTTST